MNLETTLADILHRQLKGYVELLHVLHTEHDALTRRDHHALEQCVIEKKRRIDDLENDGRALLSLIHIHNGRGVPARVEPLLKKIPAAHRPLLQENWNRLTELAGQCDRQNRINGKIIERNRQITEKALRLLKGQSDSPDAYAADGTYAATTTPKPLATA